MLDGGFGQDYVQAVQAPDEIPEYATMDKRDPHTVRQDQLDAQIASESRANASAQRDHIELY